MPTDFTGHKVGKLTVMRLAVRGKHPKWECVCDCGEATVVSISEITSRANHGSRMIAACKTCRNKVIFRGIDLRGKTFGKLTVISLASNQGKRKWECRCECGETVLVVGHRLEGNTYDPSYMVGACNTCRSRTCTVCGDLYFRSGNRFSCTKPECRGVVLSASKARCRKNYAARHPGSKMARTKKWYAGLSQEQRQLRRKRQYQNYVARKKMLTVEVVMRLNNEAACNNRTYRRRIAIFRLLRDAQSLQLRMDQSNERTSFHKH